MNSWQSRLQQRRAQFLVRSGEKLESVQQSLSRLKLFPQDGDSLKSVNQHFHQLAGAGGIYELDALCDMAIAAEEICSRLLKDHAPVGRVDHEKLELLTTGLLSFIANVDGLSEGASSAIAHSAVVSSGGHGRAESVRAFDIVIADDDHDNLIALHRLFEEQKMSVRTVKSGSGARGALLTRLPDALVVSVPLPDSSGYDIVHQLRSLPGGHRCVAVLSGEHTVFRSKVEAIRAGADAYFEEPVDPRQVVARVKSLLERDKVDSYKILSVEDDPEQAEFIKHTLESAGYTVYHICDGAQFEEALLSFAPDLVLLDIMLGDINGHELARFVRQSERFATLPVIFLTTENQLNMHIESARSGGDEHLIKPISPQLLVATIAGRLEKHALLKQFIGRDGATQLMTFSTFMDQVERFCSIPKKVAGGAALLQFDIDKLDAVNERYGHVAGEKTIVDFAAIIRNTFRQSEALGRIGGDDFSVIVENLNLQEVVQLADHVLQTFVKAPHMANSRAFKVTASCGVSWLRPGLNARLWMTEASQAVATAKKRGGNCTAAAEPAQAPVSP